MAQHSTNYGSVINRRDETITACVHVCACVRVRVVCCSRLGEGGAGLPGVGQEEESSEEEESVFLPLSQSLEKQ